MDEAMDEVMPDPLEFIGVARGYLNTLSKLMARTEDLAMECKSAEDLSMYAHIIQMTGNESMMTASNIAHIHGNMSDSQLEYLQTILQADKPYSQIINEMGDEGEQEARVK